MQRNVGYDKNRARVTGSNPTVKIALQIICRCLHNTRRICRTLTPRIAARSVVPALGINNIYDIVVVLVGAGRTHKTAVIQIVITLKIGIKNTCPQLCINNSLNLIDIGNNIGKIVVSVYRKVAAENRMVNVLAV